MIKRGAFIIPSSSKEAVRQYIIESDPVRQFAEERLERAESGGLTATMIYDAYKPYANDRGYKEMNVSTFGARLKPLGFEQRKSNGKKYWKIKFKGSIQFNKLKPDEGVSLN